jgi:hypothetical protein
MAYTKQDIDKISADEYRDKLQNEPGFADAVNVIEFGVKDARDRQSTQRAGYQPAAVNQVVIGHDPEGREIYGDAPGVAVVPAAEIPVAEVPATVEAAAVAPVAEVPATVAPVEEIYEYQPTDDNGLPIGGIQRIKYTGKDDLIAKLAKNHSESIKGMRKLSRNVRLGISDEQPVAEEIPETAPKYTAEDEVVRFTEADFPGLAPETAKKKAEALNRNQDETIQNRALLEANAFTAAEPRYVRSNDNMQELLTWMVKRNLKPVRANFQLAFDSLVAKGILLLPPMKREEATVPVVAPVANGSEISAPATVDSRITVPPVAQPKRPVAGVGTGLTDSNTSNVEPITRDPLVEGFILEVPVMDEKGKATGQVKVYKGLEALDKMPSDEYKRRYNANPTAFIRQVDAVESTRKRRAAR